MSLRLGERIGDYEVVGLLGAGGMGAVYQVRHLISDRMEAMKVLLPDLLATPESAERFMREIRLQASLNHPNIVSLHNAMRIDDRLVMVMEYVDGQTLADVNRRERLRVGQAIDILVQTLAALEYAHTRGIVHRDVKPSNIILTRHGGVKLMDFGIARNDAAIWGSLTSAGAAVGSLYYMSPEQVDGVSVDRRSDVYGAGVTLYETLTGQRPIQGKTAAEVLEAQRHQVPVAPRQVNPGIPEDLSRVTMRALEKVPGRRFDSAQEFREALMLVGAALSNPGETVAISPSLAGAEARDIKTPTPGSGTPPTLSGAMQFDPLGLDRLRKELAKHIGPMAKLLVDRAAKRSRTWQELYSQLAPEIPAGRERERFLASCPR